MSRSRPVFSALVLFAIAAGSAGCVEVALREADEPFDYTALPEPHAPGPADGTIWPGDYPSGSFLFFDRKARGVGDLVTVVLVEDVRALGEANTEVESTSRLSAQVDSDIGFADLVSRPVRGFLRFLGFDDPGEGVTLGETLTAIDAETENEFEGEGTTERRGTFNGVVTCRVVQVLPGNVFHIRGRRAIVVNHEMQYLTVEGLVRREDVRIDNTVPSTFLAEARLTYDGLGVLDDKQRPGWIARIFSWIYPY